MFKGLSAFPLTPADPDGRVQVDQLQRLVARLIGTGVSSVGLLGSTGTYAYLSRAERARAVAAAVEASDGKLPLIVGVGAMRTDEAVALAHDAKVAGADAVLMAPVSYTPLTQDEAFLHYHTVAKAAGLSMCVYNNPGTTHFQFSQDLLERLAKLDAVQAVKMPPPVEKTFAEDLEALRPALAGMEVGYSADWVLADALLGGARSFYSAIAGTLPAPLVTLSEACLAGDRTKAHELNQLLEPLWALCRAHGSLRVAHAIAENHVLIETALPLPLRGLPSKDRDALEQALGALS